MNCQMTIMTVARVITAIALACAAGCANFSAIAPGDSAQSVADRVGKPVTVWKNSDGSELWQYPQGYYATQTFMVTIGADQRVREVHQALSELVLCCGLGDLEAVELQE